MQAVPKLLNQKKLVGQFNCVFSDGLLKTTFLQHSQTRAAYG
jgi:hypothetical protein